MAIQKDVLTEISGQSTEERVKTFGFDTQRMFANQAQVFTNGSVTLIVFKENAGTAASGEESLLVRNIASIVMPTDIARDLGTIMTTNALAALGRKPAESEQESE